MSDVSLKGLGDYVCSIDILMQLLDGAEELQQNRHIENNTKLKFQMNWMNPNMHQSVTYHWML